MYHRYSNRMTHCCLPQTCFFIMGLIKGQSKSCILDYFLFSTTTVSDTKQNRISKALCFVHGINVKNDGITDTPFNDDCVTGIFRDFTKAFDTVYHHFSINSAIMVSRVMLCVGLQVTWRTENRLLCRVAFHPSRKLSRVVFSGLLFWARYSFYCISVILTMYLFHFRTHTCWWYKLNLKGNIYRYTGIFIQSET